MDNRKIKTACLWTEKNIIIYSGLCNRLSEYLLHIDRSETLVQIAIVKLANIMKGFRKPSFAAGNICIKGAVY